MIISLKKILFFICCVFIFIQSKASHIFGGELGYTHVSGYTYQIKLTLYGDCSGNSFPNLFSAIPEIAIYNGNSAYSNIFLSPYGTLGQEVTPVCPSEILNTKCNGGTLPGVAQFVFVGNVTLSGPSNDWNFYFNGSMGVNNLAGRSNSITNIVTTSPNSIFKLQATLNNSTGPNNSSIFTSIPTPFFCINIPQQYNQGAIDSDGDLLSFELTSGLDANGGVVSYLSGYSYLAPLAVVGGSFSFNNSNGQLSFQPNIIQNSMVVTKVIETKNGVVVGTSMREMTFVVLNNCNNQSPIGQIASTSTGTISNFNTIRICDNGISNLQFTVNASDPDFDTITATVSGLPIGATYTLAGNNTPQIAININWNIPANLPLGTTIIYITFQDNGCPLSSKQTIAYSIINEQPIMASSSVEGISCLASNDGQILINASSTNGTLQYAINGASYQLSNIFSGLTIGTYTIQIKDANNCSLSLIANVNTSPHPEIVNLEATDITCYGKQNGIISLSAIPNSSIFNYILLPNMDSNQTGIFKQLAANNYTLIAYDTKGCSDTTTATILEPQKLAFGTIQITNASCKKNNGKIQANSNALHSSTYILSPGLITNGIGYFDNLPAGLYTVTVQTGSDCSVDTIVYIANEAQSFFINTTQENLPCNGWGNEGSATVNPIGGKAPYTYFWDSSPPQIDQTATQLYYGWYHVSVTDASGCELIDTIYINPGSCCEQIFFPNAFSPNGDGINDTWRMVTTTGMEIKQFAIYNRYGKQIWHSINQRHEWDGTYQNEPVELGTYYFVLKYKCLTDGKNYLKTGDIIVIK